MIPWQMWVDQVLILIRWNFDIASVELDEGSVFFIPAPLWRNAVYLFLLSENFRSVIVGFGLLIWNKFIICSDFYFLKVVFAEFF